MHRTTNTAWGFHGTISSEAAGLERAADRVYHEAAERLIALGFTAQKAIEILDSRLGRAFADSLPHLRQIDENDRETQAADADALIAHLRAGGEDAKLRLWTAPKSLRHYGIA